LFDEAVPDKAARQLLFDKAAARRSANRWKNRWTGEHGASVAVSTTLKAIVRRNRDDGTWAVGWEDSYGASYGRKTSFAPSYFSGYHSREEAEAMLPVLVEGYRRG
jgi:hypothetical protein